MGSPRGLGGLGWSGMVWDGLDGLGVLQGLILPAQTAAALTEVSQVNFVPFPSFTANSRSSTLSNVTPLSPPGRGWRKNCMKYTDWLGLAGEEDGPR